MRLFFFDYNREGPGVSKDAPPKEGIALFWDIFLREFTSLFKLNLLFIITCIPIVTIGPAIGAMTAVTIKMVQDKPSDLYYDFKEAIKKNWKSSFVIFIFQIIFVVILSKSLIFCIRSEGLIYNIIISILVIAGILFGIWSIYIYPMSVSVNLTLREMFKNSFLLSIIYVKYSIITLIICMGLLEASAVFFPFNLLAILFCTFSFVSFFSSFCAWSGIKKYIIKTEE